MVIVGDFQAAIFQVGHAVEFVFQIEPRGQVLAARNCISPCGMPKKNNFLARNEDAWAQKIGEKFREPGAAGKDERAGGNSFAVGGFRMEVTRRSPEARATAAGRYCTPIFLGFFDDGLYGAASHAGRRFRVRGCPRRLSSKAICG